MYRHHWHRGRHYGWRPFWFMPFGFLLFPLIFFLFFGLFKVFWPLLLIGLGIAIFTGWGRRFGSRPWRDDWKPKHDWGEKPKHDFDDKPKRDQDDVIIV
jgi:hypothetical protein